MHHDSIKTYNRILELGCKPQFSVNDFKTNIYLGNFTCVNCNNTYKRKIKDVVRQNVKHPNLCKVCILEQSRKVKNRIFNEVVLPKRYDYVYEYLGKFFSYVLLDKKTKHIIYGNSKVKHLMKLSSFEYDYKNKPEKCRELFMRFVRRYYPINIFTTTDFSTTIIDTRNIKITASINKQKRSTLKPYFNNKRNNRTNKHTVRKIKYVLGLHGISLLSEPKTTKDYLIAKCSCGNEFKNRFHNMQQFNVWSCLRCRKSTSAPEKLIFDLLDSLNIEYQIHKKFKDLGNLELDVFIPEKNLGIEINGGYWHSEERKPLSHLKNKKLKFLEKNINVLMFYEIDVNKKLDLIKSMILAKINQSPNKIFARKLNFVEIDKEKAKDFFSANHISDSNVCIEKAFGLINAEEELISCIGFSKPRFNNKYDWEIIRFATKKHTTVIGGLSKLIKNSKLENIITYADLLYSDGKGYASVGFKKVYTTAPGYFYSKSKYKMYSRMTFQKHKIKKYMEKNQYGITEFDESKTELENMQDNGYTRIPNAGNFVFVL